MSHCEDASVPSGATPRASNARPARSAAVGGLEELRRNGESAEGTGGAEAVDQGMCKAVRLKVPEHSPVATASHAAPSEAPELGVRSWRRSSRKECSKQRAAGGSDQDAPGRRPARQRRTKGRRGGAPPPIPSHTGWVAENSSARATSASRHRVPGANVSYDTQELSGSASPAAEEPKAPDVITLPVAILQAVPETGGIKDMPAPSGKASAIEGEPIRAGKVPQTVSRTGIRSDGRAEQCWGAEGPGAVPLGGHAATASRPVRHRRSAKPPTDPAFDTSHVDEDRGALERAPAMEQDACACEAVPWKPVVPGASMEARSGGLCSGIPDHGRPSAPLVGEKSWTQPVTVPHASPTGRPGADSGAACSGKEGMAVSSGDALGGQAPVVDGVVWSQSAHGSGVDPESLDRLPQPEVRIALDAAVHVSQPQLHPGSPREPATASAVGAATPERCDGMHGPCGRLAAEGGGHSGVAQSAGCGGENNVDAGMECSGCATPVQHAGSSTLGPGFISASELLESQRSGPAPSSGGARSPGEEVLLSFDAVPAPTDSGRSTPPQAALPLPLADPISGAEVVWGEPAGVTGAEGRETVSPMSPLRLQRGSCGRDAVVAMAGDESVDVTEDHADENASPSDERATCAERTDTCAMTAAEDVATAPAARLVHDHSATEKEVAPVNFNELSDWDALTGERGGKLMVRSSGGIWVQRTCVFVICGRVHGMVMCQHL